MISKSVEFPENQALAYYAILWRTPAPIISIFLPLFYAVGASGQTWVPV